MNRFEEVQFKSPKESHLPRYLGHQIPGAEPDIEHFFYSLFHRKIPYLRFRGQSTNVAIHKVWVLVSKIWRPKDPVPMFWLTPKQAGTEDPNRLLVLARELNPHPSSSFRTVEQGRTRSAGWKRYTHGLCVHPREKYGYLQIVIIVVVTMIIAIITGMVMEVKLA